MVTRLFVSNGGEMFKCGEHGDVVAAGTKAEATGWRGGWGRGLRGGAREHSGVTPAIAALRNTLFY